MCVFVFCTHALVCAVHAVPLMVGRLTDGQAEPNLQSKYQAGRLIAKAGPVRHRIFKHERVAQLQICNSITEHIRHHSVAPRSLRTHTVLHAGTDARSPP